MMHGDQPIFRIPFIMFCIQKISMNAERPVFKEMWIIPLHLMDAISWTVQDKTIVCTQVSAQTCEEVLNQLDVQGVPQIFSGVDFELETNGKR